MKRRDGILRSWGSRNQRTIPHLFRDTDGYHSAEGAEGVKISLSKPNSKEVLERGKQQCAPGRPDAIWVLETDDCQKTYSEMQAKGVRFLSEPQERPYSVEVRFEDLYCNVY